MERPSLKMRIHARAGPVRLSGIDQDDTATTANSNRSASAGTPVCFVLSIHRGQFRAKEHSEPLRLVAHVRKGDLTLKRGRHRALTNDPLSTLVAVGFLTDEEMGAYAHRTALAEVSDEEPIREIVCWLGVGIDYRPGSRSYRCRNSGSNASRWM